MINKIKAKKYSISVPFICLLCILFLPSRTPQIKGESGFSSIKKIKLGGINQLIMIRGKDISNPILLFLHGGPGYPQISFALKYQKEIENEFIVVNWDQRGSGMSYSPKIPKHTMNRNQFVDDTKELIEYLCKKYKKEQVYLVGHSWGSELGLYVVNKYPERISTYISIGQVVDGTEGELISYNYTLDTAKMRKDSKAIKQLNNIGSPPYKDNVNDTLVQRKWLSKYGGVERRVNTLIDIILASIFSPEYTGIDGIKFALGSKFSADTMWGQNLDVNFIELVPKVDVPIYFFAGRYDYNTPSELIKKYYIHIEAPYKVYLV